MSDNKYNDLVNKLEEMEVKINNKLDYIEALFVTLVNASYDAPQPTANGEQHVGAE